MVALSTPMLLYMRPAIIATVKKGSPWMKYRVGTQRIGERVASVSGVMAAPVVQGQGARARRTGERPGASPRPSSQARKASSAPGA